MKNKKNFCHVLFRPLALVMAFSMIFTLAACSKSSSSSSSVKAKGAYAGLDISKPVTLTFYNLGDVPTDMKKIQDEANSKYFKPLLNCTVDFNFLSWSDYKTKYDLILAGGDQVDLIYSSNWCFYTQEASKGAFKQLTMDYVKKYMPQTYKSQQSASWDQMSINGKIYGVSQNYDSTVHGYKYIAYRDDLRQKYGLSPITNFDTLQQYVLAIAAKDKSIQAIASSGENDEIRNILCLQMNSLSTLDPSYDFMYQLNNTKAPSDNKIFYVYSSDYFKKYAETMADWAGKGAWSKNAINNTVTVNDAYANGQGSLIAWNGTVFTYGKKLDQSGAGKTAYVDITPNIKFKEGSFSGDAIAIAHSSQNSDRAAMALDLMKNNKDLNRLLEGGIEGTHYVLNSNGTVALGTDATKYP